MASSIWTIPFLKQLSAEFNFYCEPFQSESKNRSIALHGGVLVCERDDTRKNINCFLIGVNGHKRHVLNPIIKITH